MNKYPLIKLLSDSFGGFQSANKSKKKRLTNYEKQVAEQSILRAKDKRAARNAKRARTQGES
jgi:hypothetical protein